MKVLAIHDISTLGKASLNVITPILSNFGITVCALPTAALSSVTRGYGEPVMHDLTDFMQKSLEHFKMDDAQFDWVYSGFLGNPKQVDIIIEIIKMQKNAKVLIDPVLGDDGELYLGMTNEIVVKMRELVAYADVITPNWTEANFLNEKYYKKVENIVITGVPNEQLVEVDTVVNNPFEVIKGTYEPKEYSGAGDAFASFVLGNMSIGKNFSESVKSAGESVAKIISITDGIDLNIEGEKNKKINGTQQ